MISMLRQKAGFLLVLLLLVLSGCSDTATVVQKKVEFNETSIIDFSSVVTVKNRSYVPLDLEGDAAENHRAILEILKEFENKKKVEIINWKISDQQIAHSTPSFTHGLWIDHKPR